MKSTQEENARKGEAMLTTFEVIKKIYVSPYIIEGEDEREIHVVLLGAKEEDLEDFFERNDDDADIIGTPEIIEMLRSEAEERYGKDRIEYILGARDGYVDWIHGENIFVETLMPIEELREKRRIESEPFDAEEIIRKIASEYVITQRRKESLIKIINKLL